MKLLQIFIDLWNKIGDSGVALCRLPHDIKSTRYINRFALIIGILGILYGPFLIFQLGIFDARMNVAELLVSLIFLTIPLLTKNGHFIWAKIICCLLPSAFLLFICFLIGKQDGTHFLFLISAMSPLMLFRNKWTYTPIFLINVLCFFFVHFYFESHLPIVTIDQKFLDISYINNMVLIFILLFSAIQYFIQANLAYERELTESKILIEEGKKISEELLLNILPHEVAEELKKNGKYEPKLFEDVSVMFTDFKGFTTKAEMFTPQELIQELNECFKGFDAIMDKHHIEKIKTIGDAYMAVCGLPVPCKEHAENLLHAACDIRDFMDERKKMLGERTFDIRIGIHSGTVVAGIVGVKKYAYDIWGDIVNTAARMEQNSLAGKVNISEITYNLVKEKFDCEYRGEIEAKNKGKMKMYFVEGVTIDES